MRIFAGTTVVSQTSLILASCLLLPVHNTAAKEVGKAAGPIIEQRDVTEGISIHVDSSADSPIENNSSMSGVVTSLHEDGFGLTMDFADIDLASILRRRFDMSNSGDADLHREAFPSQLGTQFVLTRANQDVEVLVSQSDKNLTVESSPKELEKLAGDEGPGKKSDTPTTEVQPVDPVNEVYVSGVEWRKSITEVGQDLIDVDLKVSSRNDQEKETTFKDILTSQVIEYIADYYDINIVIDTSVDELITIHLEGANWFEDLARIAKVGGLNMCSRASGTVVLTQEPTGNCPMTYLGEVLSLNFREIEVASVMVLLSDFSGNSISTCYPMEAKVSLRLKNVKWDQAFDEILLVTDLRVGRVGDSLLVRTADAQQCNIRK